VLSAEDFFETFAMAARGFLYFSHDRFCEEFSGVRQVVFEHHEEYADAVGVGEEQSGRGNGTLGGAGSS